ncbi:MAG: NAD(P)/FAD-dependent oxidoreductase [Sandaracinaceae bacterium]
MSDSAWMREVRFPVASRLPAGARCELLVIGAGIAGCSAALAAAEAGVDVLVLDARPASAGASGRNAGFVLLAHVFELPALEARLGAAGVSELIGLARENHRRLRERFGQAARHRTSGSLMLAEVGDEADRERLESAARILREHGAAPALGPPHPALAGFDVQLSLPEDGQLHPGELVRAMRHALPRFARAAVTSLEAGVAQTDGGEVRYERAVVATNAHAAQLVPLLRGVVTPQRAQMLATAPGLARVLEPVAYANAGYDYFRQREDGAVFVGGRRHLFEAEEATDALEPSEAVQSSLEAYLRRHLPFAVSAPVAHRWAGTMGFSPDELPLVGRAPGLPGVHILAGFTGHGLGLAMVLADRLVDSLTAKGTVPSLFDPARFSEG